MGPLLTCGCPEERHFICLIGHRTTRSHALRHVRSVTAE